MVASKIPCTRIVVSSTATLGGLNHSVTTTTNLSNRNRSQERCSGRESDHLSVDSVITYPGYKSSIFQTQRLSRTQWCLRKRISKFWTSNIVQAKISYMLKFSLITTSSPSWLQSGIKPAILPSYSPHSHSFALLLVAETTLKTYFSEDADLLGIKSLSPLKF
jgi:hypothetical protein